MDVKDPSAPFHIQRLDDDIQLLTLNRPAKLNSLTKPMLLGLQDLLDTMESGGAGRALIITGTGEKSFCAGTDLGEIQGMSAADRLIKNKMARQLLFRLSQSPILTIAALNGLAYGGGLELAMGCTFRIAMPHVRVSLPEIKLGLIPAYGGTQFLPPLVGHDRALEMMLTGRAVSADEAERIGLISRLANVQQPLLEQALAFAREMTCYSQPAIDAVRQSVVAAKGPVSQVGLDVEDHHVRQVFFTPDASEGVRAFLEKRAPKFTHAPPHLPESPKASRASARREPGKPPFNVVVFDMDGLLLDSERPIRDAWITACHDHGVAFETEQYAQVIGRNFKDSEIILRELIDDDSVYEQVVSQTVAAIERISNGAGFQLKPGAYDLLMALQAREIRLAVASSSRRSEVRRRLTHAGVIDMFEAFACGDEVVNGKPAPDLFLLAAERIGVEPGQCLVFEDSEAGAMGALGAGMGVVLVPDLQPPSTEVRMLAIDVLSELTQVDQDVMGEWFAINAKAS